VSNEASNERSRSAGIGRHISDPHLGMYVLCTYLISHPTVNILVSKREPSRASDKGLKESRETRSGRDVSKSAGRTSSRQAVVGGCVASKQH
jgi:hypothetical protein